MFCILLLQLLLLIVVCDESSSTENNNKHFLLFIKTTEIIDEIQIVQRNLRPTVLVDIIQACDFEKTVELDKNKSMIFIYKIKVNIKRKFFRRNKPEICFYSGKDIICIAKKIRFDSENYFVKHLKFFTPITDQSGFEEELFYNPDRKKILRNEKNLCVFEMNIPNRKIIGSNCLFE